MDLNLDGMKRKELQALCKKHGIPANLASREMILRLSWLFQKDQKPLKKVKFSPENDQTFVFVESDSDSDDSKRKARSRARTKEATLTLGRTTRSKKHNTNFIEESIYKPRRRNSSRIVSDKQTQVEPTCDPQHPIASTGRTTRARVRANAVDAPEHNNSCIEEDGAKPLKRRSTRPRLTTEPRPNKRQRLKRAKTLDIQEDQSLLESKQEHSLHTAGEIVPEPNSPTGDRALKTNDDSSDATDEVNKRCNESIDELFDGHNVAVGAAFVNENDDKPLCCDITENIAIQTTESFDFHTTEEEPKENEHIVKDEAKENALVMNIEGYVVDDHLPESSSTAGDSFEDPNYGTKQAHSKGECSGIMNVNKGLKTESVTQEEECLVELALDSTGKSEPAQHISKEEAEKSSEAADVICSVVFPDTNKQMAEETSAATASYETSPQSQDEEAEETSEKRCLDNKIEADSISEVGAPRSAHHFTLERLLDENESETPSASNKNLSLDYEVRSEVSHTDDRIKSTSFIADDPVLVEDKAVVENEMGKMDHGLNTAAYSETKIDDHVVEVAMVNQTHEVLVVPQVKVGSRIGLLLNVSPPQSQEEKAGQTSEKICVDHQTEEDSTSEEEGGEPGLVDHFTLEKLLEGNESETPSASNKIWCSDYEAKNEVANEVSQTDLGKRSVSIIADDLVLLEDRVNVAYELGNMDDGLNTEDYSETKKDGNFVDVEMLNKTDVWAAVSQVDVDSRIGSELIVSSPLGDEYESQNFSQEINDGNKKEASNIDEGNKVSGNINLNSCLNIEDSLDSTTGPGKEHDAPTPGFLEELFSDHKDGKPVESDTVQEDGALSDLRILSQISENMDADCFIPSSGDGVSELGVHSAEVTASKLNTSLRNGEEADTKELHELFVEENIPRNSEENVMNNEDADQAFEKQLSEHERRTEQDVSHDLISGSGEDSNEQDDAFAIIQEYMERETHAYEFMKMNSFASLNEGRMTNDVEDAVTNSISQSGVDTRINDCGEEGKKVHPMSSEGTEIEEDNGIMVAELVLPKHTDSAQTDSADNVPVIHELPGTPKQEGACYKSFDFENLVEATKNDDISSSDSAKYTGNSKSGSVKNMVGTIEVNKTLCNLEVDDTTTNSASDEPTSEKRGSTEKTELLVVTQEKPVEFENSGNPGKIIGTSVVAFCEPITEYSAHNSKQVESDSEGTGVARTLASTKNNSSEDMSEAMELNISSTANVEIVDVLNDPVFGNEEMEEKCNLPIIRQERIDCENIEDGSKCGEQSGNVDAILDVECPRFPEDAQLRQVKFELLHESPWQTSLDEVVNSVRRNKSDPSIPMTPKHLHKVHDMKENTPSTKTERYSSFTSSRKSAKRRPLEDLHKY